jgi:hypothetical protein
MVTLDLDPSARVVRSFARLWLPLFVVTLGALVWWRLEAPTAARVVWSVGAIVAVASLASPRVARAVFIALTVATFPIALVVSSVVLLVLFFLVITPLGAWLRWRGHDPLRLRHRAPTTQWQPYPQDDDPRRATRQF